jgi:hypothetical protein
MARLDGESGRFDADFEIEETNRALRGWQENYGDQALYYRFWGPGSEVHDIWDEATGAGRVWRPPMIVKLLHATHVEGGNEDRAEGQYQNDDFYSTASFDQLKRLGMTEMDLTYQSYLNDRIVYDYRVFRVTRIQVVGQISSNQKDPIVSIEGTQVKPDEMSNDPGFERFANVKFPETA